MCGIVGVFNLDGKPSRMSKLVEMANLLKHRGLDGKGFYLKDNIGLDHNGSSIFKEIKGLET